MNTQHRCSLCPVIFEVPDGAPSAFCSKCIERMRGDVAAIDARAVRVQSGDLELLHEGVNERERVQLMAARRAGNFTGIER